MSGRLPNSRWACVIIAAMIHAVQGGTSDAVSGMSEGNARVKEGVEMVGNAGVSMERIQQGVQSVLSSVSEISAATPHDHRDQRDRDQRRASHGPDRSARPEITDPARRRGR